MKEEFAVLYGQMPVGKVESIRQGLYYRISCRYRLPGDEICRLIVRWPGGWENIGIPIPEGDGFSLIKKIPVKKISGENMSFYLISVERDPNDQEQGELNRSDTTNDNIATDEKNSCAAPDDEEILSSERHRISEDEPFDDIDRLVDLKLKTEGGEIFTVFTNQISKFDREPHRTVVGTEDVGINGGTEDLVSDPV